LVCHSQQHQVEGPGTTNNLPSSNTKIGIHAQFIQSTQDTEIRAMGLTSFKNIWQKCCPHIKICTPRQDVCHICEKLRKKIIDAVTEAEKLEASDEFRQHVIDAQSERLVYKQCVDDAKTEMHGFVRPVGPIAATSSTYTKVHYTFDFAQQLSVPHHSRQMGPLYFLSTRKIQLFGVRDDGGSTQYNYLIDEHQTIGTYLICVRADVNIYVDLVTHWICLLITFT
jgi:hypothetical protein